MQKHLFSYVFIKKSTVALLLDVTTLVISKIILTFKHIWNDINYFVISWLNEGVRIWQGAELEIRVIMTFCS